MCSIASDKPQVRLEVPSFGLSLHLHPCFVYTRSEGSEESPSEPLLLDNAIKSYGLADIIIFTISHWCLKQKPVDLEEG